MTHVLEAPVRYWKCPSCLVDDRTQVAEVHTQFHECPAMNNVSIPLVEVTDPDAKVKARQVIDGTAVRTERMDGSNDVTVFAQPAVGTFGT